MNLDAKWIEYRLIDCFEWLFAWVIIFLPNSVVYTKKYTSPNYIIVLSLLTQENIDALYEYLANLIYYVLINKEWDKYMHAYDCWDIDEN